VPIPVAARSNTSVCGLSLAGIAGSNPAGKGGGLRMSVSCEYCVLSNKDLCDGPTHHPEESYRV